MTKDVKPHGHVNCGCRKAAKFVYCMLEKDNKVSELSDVLPILI